MEDEEETCTRNCVIELRENPKKRKEKVRVGCGAGFGGDRPLAALKLMQRVKDLDYLVLECLAERTLADRFQIMSYGGLGYDPRISEWMSLLLPLAVERGTCIITNMGAMDAVGAQEKVLEVATSLGLRITVSVAHEVPCSEPAKGLGPPTEKSYHVMTGGSSTYLGAAPIVECLEKYHPNVVITSRIADAALFLAPMVYELGWNWNELDQLAQGSLAGHLLECGCQLTGGYFMHPGDKFRDFPLPSLLDLSLPYAEVSFDGTVIVAKAEGSGGVINFSTCAQQLLYEVGDPSAYITPDMVINLQEVTFQSLSDSRILSARAEPSMQSPPDRLLRLIPKDCGWKGWGEISYGGYACVERAKAAEYLVRSWMEESCPGVGCNIISYIIGLDSVKAASIEDATSWATTEDIRLRMDGLFELKDHAVQFTNEFISLYTNGPAGGGGISTGHKKEIILDKQLVEREQVFWRTGVKSNGRMNSDEEKLSPCDAVGNIVSCESALPPLLDDGSRKLYSLAFNSSPAPSGEKIPLYMVAHSRAGDKGNDLNFSIIPHFPPDVERLKLVVTPQWVKKVVSPLLSKSSFPDSNAISERERWTSEHVNVEIYEVKGISSLNVVVRNILGGGVNCSRRIDRHGKTISDVILCQQVLLPP